MKSKWIKIEHFEVVKRRNKRRFWDGIFLSIVAYCVHQRQCVSTQELTVKYFLGTANAKHNDSAQWSCNGGLWPSVQLSTFYLGGISFL